MKQLLPTLFVSTRWGETRFVDLLASALVVAATITASAAHAQSAAPSIATPAPELNAAPASVESVTARLKQLYPAMRFDSINSSELPGLYEVVMGKNVAYVEGSGRYFLFGHLFDMPVQQDLTAMRLESLNRVDFAQLPLGDAIKTVRGNGSRVVAVFSDPDCPHCRKLETSLLTMNNVTVYTFLYPLAQLHPAARDKAVAVWCSKNRKDAWENLMVRGQQPAPVLAADKCQHPIDRTIALGAKLGINGTPMIVAADGRQMPGALEADKLDQWLNLPQKVSAAPSGPTTKTVVAVQPKGSKP